MSPDGRVLHGTARYLHWLLILGCLSVGAYAFFRWYGGEPYVPPADESAVKESVVEPPPFTDEIKAQLEASKGFAALISYTDAGFEPATVRVQAGDTIRFTNNSSGEMWVAASTKEGALYPGKGTCGQSPFDTCKAISRGMFYEFTFEKAGTWGYHDNSQSAMTGKVIAE
jgi:plastocyanin